MIDISDVEIEKGEYNGRVVVDGANGVGGEKLLELMKLLPQEMEISLRNSGKSGEGAMNEFVGADFVQKEKTIPRGFSIEDAGKRSVER